MTRRHALFLFALSLSAACSDSTGPGGNPALRFASVSAGDGFTCALTADGRAWCWGMGLFGQIGNGATSTQPLPAVVAGERRYLSLSAGSDHACAIAQDSTAWCWGLNDFRELGSQTSLCNSSFQFVSCASAPLRVPGTLRFDSISVGGYATCALARAEPYTAGTQTAWCWGWNTRGELGSGATGSVISEPAQVSGSRILRSLDLDLYHACGIDAAGAVFCWGSNAYGQLAVDTTRTPRCLEGPATGLFCAPTPLQSDLATSLRIVSTGSTHTCVLGAGGEAACAGSNQYGVIGRDGSLGGNVPVIVEGGHVFASISAGGEHTCALTAAGEAWCWGMNHQGQLGNAVTVGACAAFGDAAACSQAPVAVEGAPAFTRISAGTGHSCGLTADGQLWCWGRGTEGQLGNGAQASSPVPVRVALPLPE